MSFIIPLPLRPSVPSPSRALFCSLLERPAQATRPFDCADSLVQLLARSQLATMFEACAPPEPPEARAPDGAVPLTDIPNDAKDEADPLKEAGPLPAHLLESASKQAKYFGELLTAALTSARPLGYVKAELGKALNVILKQIASAPEEYDPSVVAQLRDVQALVQLPKATFQVEPLQRLEKADSSVAMA